MALSNTAVPRYYGEFRDTALAGEIPICREIEMEMHRIVDLIADPRYWYDDKAVEGFIRYCEDELTLTDGEPLHLLDSFKLWAESIFGWYGRCYSCSFEDLSGNCVANFVPCYRKSDETIGMYNTITNTFCTKTGDGSLQKGPDV